MLAQQSVQHIPFAPGPLLISRSFEEAAATLNGNLSESRTVRPQRRGAHADIRFTLRHLPNIKLFGAYWGEEAVAVSSAPLSYSAAYCRWRRHPQSTPGSKSRQRMILFTPLGSTSSGHRHQGVVI